MAWRRFRRPRRPLRPRSPNRALRRLRRANGLMMAGDFAAAAQLFDQLAQGALERGLPQAPQLTLRAAEAYLKAGDRETARERALRGLEMLANAGRWAILHRAGERTVATLEAQGHADLAAEIRQALDRWLAQAPPPMAARRAQSLPTECPHCGAPVHPDEVEWQHEVPLCAYCGKALTSNAPPL